MKHLLWLCMGLLGCGDQTTALREVSIPCIWGASGTNPGDQPDIEPHSENIAKGLALAKANYRFVIPRDDHGGDPAAAVEFTRTRIHEGAKIILYDGTAFSVPSNKVNYEDSSEGAPHAALLSWVDYGVTVNVPDYVDPTGDALNQAAVRDGGKWNYLANIPILSAASTLAKLVASKGDVNGDGHLKVAIIRVGTPGLADYVGAVLGAVSPGVKLEKFVLPATIDANTYNWQNLLAEVTDSVNSVTSETDGVPDAVVELSFPAYAAAFAKVYGSNPIPIFHSTSFRRWTTKQQLGVLVNGHEGVDFPIAEGEPGEALRLEWRERLGADTPQYLQLTHDGVLLAALAYSKAIIEADNDPDQVTSEAVRDALMQLNDPAGEVIGYGAEEFAKALQLFSEGKSINFEGTSGHVDFNENRKVTGRLAHFRGVGDHFEEVGYYDCALAGCPKQ